MAILRKVRRTLWSRRPNRARRRDLARWATLHIRLGPAETLLASTWVVCGGINGETREGACYLTDEALHGGVADGMRSYRWRLSFSEITTHEVEGYQLLVRSLDGIHVMDLPPGQPSDEFLLGFFMLMKEKAAHSSP